MDILLAVLNSTLGMALDAAPWLLLGIVLAGLLKAFLPEAWLARWVGGESAGAIGRAALVGAPLPLCSCSVLPAALGLRRQGAGRGPTLAFMISTPETGVDSVALTYALLGPVFAILRPLGALVSAFSVGLAVARWGGEVHARAEASSGCSTACCGSGCAAETLQPAEAGPSCCVSGNCDLPPPAPSVQARAWQGVHYAMTTLWDDLAPWLLATLLLAGAMTALVPPETFAALGDGLAGMLLLFLLGLPMYVCATAATPVAAALLATGVGPGAVLVFLLAGPAANLGTLGVLKREFGGRVLLVYLVTLAIVTLLLGLIAQGVVDAFGLTIEVGSAEPEVAPPLAWSALGLLAALTVWRLIVWGRRP
ncbi:MAG: SO_0444 family Cu/Zn efflux transporter [Pseudomonadota bacterium]